MKLILENQTSGWTVRMFGVDGMPDQVALPLPFTSTASLAMVASDMINRFPGAMIQHREGRRLLMVQA